MLCTLTGFTAAAIVGLGESMRQVIQFEYTLVIDGELVSESGEPMGLLTGVDQLPAGLEAAMIGKAPGRYSVTLPPEQAYGGYDPELQMQVLPEDLPEEPRIGGAYAGESDDGQELLFRVIAIQDGEVTLDGNHEWAGKTLEYTFTIHSTREATAEEIDHGHVHGEGGHHH
jgi:FKBP-type peptidyl-prolyl cis-trans isomerase SlyD